MKNIFRNKIGIVAGVIVMMLSNCTKLTDNLSTDPVNITKENQVPVPQFISGVETSLIGVYEGDVARTAGMWCQYFDGEDRQYAGLNNYVTSGQDYDNEWVTIYTAIFNNTKIIKSRSRAVNNNTAVGIAQIMEAMSIGTAADLWGDVPFSEICQYPTIATPKFDTQASVYAAAQVLLDSAIVNLSLAGKVGSEDFFYNGDINKWTAAAHTIKARLYLHVRDYANVLSQAAAGISNVTGNMMAPHGSAYLQTFNLYYSFLTYDRSGYMADNIAYAPTLLDPSSANYRGNSKTNENGRMNYYFAPFAYWGGLNTGAKYDPNVLVTFDWGTAAKYNGFFGAITSFPLVTFQENALLLAEANAKLGNTQPAIDALNNLRAYYRTGAQFGASTAYINDPDLGGVKYDDYVAADFNAGGIENADNISASQALIREVLEERYVTLIGQIEGYTDMRRTGNFLKIPYAPGKTDFPRRLLYSQIEVNTNPNVPTTGVGLYDPVTSFSTPY